MDTQQFFEIMIGPFDTALARLARARKFLTKIWLGSLEPKEILARSTSNLGLRTVFYSYLDVKLSRMNFIQKL